MADDADPGVDKFDVLAAINGAQPPAPEPAPPADAEPIPAALPSPEAAISASGAALRRPTRWGRHRHEIAALVAAFVGVVWLSVGIAERAWTPSLVGVAFGVGALLIGAFEIWADE